MKIRLLISVCLTVAATVLSFSTWSQQRPARVALLIGNADYPDASTPLSTTIRDARSLAEELRRVDFDVELKENVGKADMQRAIDAFTGKIRNGSAALFYFSGYGIQVARQTYLIPVNAQLWTEAEVRRDGISLDSALAEMHRKGAKVKIVIIDASRRNPFERRFRPSAEGLAALEAPESTLAMYAAAPGKVIRDGTGANSLLIGELIRELRVPHVSAEEVFNRTRIGVSRASNNEQIPWVSSSLGEQFYFGTPPAAASAPSVPARPTPKPAETLVPEFIPFVPDRDRNSVRVEYLPAPDHKALAISVSVARFVSGRKDIEGAKRGALENCQKAQDAINLANKCELYAVGDAIVFTRGSPPMPPEPWINRELSIERPFVVRDVPLISDAGRGWLEKNYPTRGKPKALAIARANFGMAAIGQSVEEVLRRALEICGGFAGFPCMIVALDDVFVVPIPTKMKPVGIFHADSSSAIVPQEREGVALRLRKAKTGWNAVAVGAGGRPGLMLNAKNESDAVDGALADCRRQDRDCRVIGLGPFEVEPK
jgi:hypothetical protein